MDISRVLSKHFRLSKSILRIPSSLEIIGNLNRVETIFAAFRILVFPQ